MCIYIKQKAQTWCHACNNLYCVLRKDKAIRHVLCAMWWQIIAKPWRHNHVRELHWCLVYGCIGKTSTRPPVSTSIFPLSVWLNYCLQWNRFWCSNSYTSAISKTKTKSKVNIKMTNPAFCLKLSKNLTAARAWSTLQFTFLFMNLCHYSS